MKKEAFISDCKKYRYTLERTWNNNPKIMFIMLNPSTADANTDDATIRRCIAFAKLWGYGGIYVCNIFAFRSTNPKELLNYDNPFGDENIFHTRQITDKVEKIVCAWGNEPIMKKILKVKSINSLTTELLSYAIDKLYYLEISKNGIPKHPLYLKGNLQPKKMFK